MFIQEQLSKGDGLCAHAPTHAPKDEDEDLGKRERLISGSVKPRRRGTGGVRTHTTEHTNKEMDAISSHLATSAPTD